MTTAIATRELTRVHGDTRALDGVTISVKANTITGLLGRNGAGKTTFMALATAQDQPTSGEVLIDGERPFERADVLEKMCFIRDNQRYPDDYRLHHALKAARIFYPNWNDDLARELIDLFRIPKKTIVKKFSRGQFSALGIVLGLASRAPITFFDEPYLGLDATSRIHFYDVLLRDFAEHPRTIVLSTHLIDEMDKVLEHVIILDRGRVVKDALADDLRGTAHRVSGRASAVNEYSASRTVLIRQEMGPLATAVVEGRITVADREAAELGGLELGPVSLQELVAAYGVEGATQHDGGSHGAPGGSTPGGDTTPDPSSHADQAHALKGV